MNSEFKGLRVLVLRENWFGCTGLSAFNALVRLGASAAHISEAEFVPHHWQSTPMKVLSRLVRYPAVKEFNRVLVNECEAFRPDLFLVFKGQFVLGETVRQIGRLGATRYCFFPDVSTTAHGPYLPKSLVEYDWIFTTKSFGPRDIKELYGIDKCSFLPHAFDPEVHRPRQPSERDHREYDCDLSFIGTWSKKKEETLTDLVERLPDLKVRIWGNRWSRLATSSPLKRYLALRPVLGLGYAAAIGCSRINLALLSERVRGASSGDLITSRTFHIPACGGLMLHERTDELLDIFRENENCVCFGSGAELAEKVTWLLKDDNARSRIARAGQALVEAGHSWDHRIRRILRRYTEDRSLPDNDRQLMVG